MPLQLPIIEEHGIHVAQAYGVITDWNLQGATHQAMVTLSWFADLSAFNQGLPPFRVDELTLTLDEQATGVTQLISLLYGIVQARPAYATTVTVP